MESGPLFAVGEVARLVSGGKSSRHGTKVTVVRTLGSNRYAVKSSPETTKSTVVSGDCLKKFTELARPGNYTIVGTWDAWDGQEMDWNGHEECFECIVTLGSGRSESFKILAGGDWDQCLYPDHQNANPYETHSLLGPDPNTSDTDWTIGLHHEDRGAEGKRYKVRLHVSDDGRPKSVRWEAAEAEAGSAAQEPRTQDTPAEPSASKRISVRDLLKRCAPRTGSPPKERAAAPPEPEPQEWWMPSQRSKGSANRGRSEEEAARPTAPAAGPASKPLRSLLGEARPGRPARELAMVESKLQRIGISTAEELAESLHRGDTNQLLEGAELSTLSPSWLGALAPLLDVEVGLQKGAPPKEPQPPPVPQATQESEEKAATKPSKLPKARRWEIVGGTSTNGLLVRDGHDVTSSVLTTRLDTGAIVEEVDLVGQRLHFSKVSGNGPQQGWILISLKDKELARIVTEEEPRDDAEEIKEPAAPAAPAVPTAPAPKMISKTKAVPKQGEISQDLRQWAKKLDVQLAQLDNQTPEHLAELFDRLDRVHKSTATKLQAQYAQMGFAIDEDDPMERAEMARMMQEAIITQEMNLEHLQEACSLKGVVVELDQPREELLKLLANSTWESLGIPVTRIPDLDVARHLLRQINGLANAGLNRLSMECKQLDLPVTQTPEGMVALLKQAHIWRVLPVRELLRECRAHGITPNVQDSNDESAQEELYQQLLKCLQGNRCEARGIPAKRLGSLQLANQLLAEVDKLQVMGPMSLQSEYKRMCLIFDANLDMQILVDRLRDHLIWENLPLPLLQSECRQRGLVHNDGRNAMVKRLSQRLDSELELEKLGLPVQRMGYAAAMEVQNQLDEIRALSLEDLVEWYKCTGCPDDNTVTKEGLVSLLKEVAIWEALPLQELVQVATQKKLTAQQSPQFSSNNEHREFLITKLLQQQCMDSWKEHLQSHRIGDFEAASKVMQRYTNFQNMSDEDLSRAYTERGLPRMATADRAAILDALKMVMIWDALPLLELQIECLERSDKIQCDFENKDDEENQRSSLIQQLTVEMLKSAYEELGIPVEYTGYLQAYKVGRELISITTMEVEELVEKCNMQALPVTPDMTSSELRSQLVSCTLWHVQPADKLFKALQKTGLQGRLSEQMLRILMSTLQHA